jgi:hypothetical protein
MTIPQEIKAHSGPKASWLSGALILSSLPIVLIGIEILVELAAVLWARTQPPTGIVDTTHENIILFLGLYFALPCGLLNLILGAVGRAKGRLSKKAYITGMTLGVLGILFGIAAWTLYIMVSSFVF